MTVKLHINVSQGLIEVEGDADLVREIYADYRDQLLSVGMSRRTPAPETEEEEANGSGEEGGRTRARSKRRGSPKRRAASEDTGSGVSADAPKLDRDLDTAKLGDFYSQFEPKNHPEKILIFLEFLTEELGIAAPNTDQVYTCYVRANERVPKAFAQAFRDAGGRTFGYVDYKSATDLRITTAGRNHFKFDLKRKTAE